MALTWFVLLLVLWRGRPDQESLREAVRLIPDVLRLVTRLARDRALPLGVRVRLWLLVAYLAMPFDVVPDVIPVVGYADDAMVIMLALRSVVRRAGREALDEHWPGTPEGLAIVTRMASLSPSPSTV